MKTFQENICEILEKQHNCLRFECRDFIKLAEESQKETKSFTKEKIFGENMGLARLYEYIL